ncbi:MAG: SDR family oxidoreductase [Desulfobacterales bacterium]|nr:MAG: SDR family oxidoreductase [Desulfobacterales bacterium]
MFNKLHRLFKLFRILLINRASIVYTSPVRSKVLTDIAPEKWEIHKFGLSENNWRKLQGRSYWVTGAGTGYGQAIASSLAAAGAQVFLTGRRIEMLRESLRNMANLDIDSGNCHLIPADLTKYEDIRGACKTVAEMCDSLDGLINNAAIPSKPGSQYPLQDDPIEYWDKIMAINLKAPWLLTRTVFPHMRLNGVIRVIFMTSEAGWASTPGFGMYNVSKAGLNSLGHSMAMEYSKRFPDDDIQFNIVQPGEARTEMNQGSSDSPFSVVSIVLRLLVQPKGSANGKFFDRLGRHMQFCHTWPYERPLI